MRGKQIADTEQHSRNLTNILHPHIPAGIVSILRCLLPLADRNLVRKTLSVQPMNAIPDQEHRHFFYPARVLEQQELQVKPLSVSALAP